MSIHDEQKKVATGITDGTDKQEQVSMDAVLEMRDYIRQLEAQQRKPIDLASAIEYADARWVGVDVPMEWLHHFLEGLNTQQRKPMTDDEAFALVQQDYRMEEYASAAVKLIRRTEAAHGIKEKNTTP